MTAPFSFPTINPGQPIMEPGMGDTISSGIAGVIKAMQDRQQLDQQRQEFESKQQYFKTLDEGNALDNQQKRDKMKQEQKGLEAKGIANDAFAQWAGSGGDFTKVGQIIASGKFKNNPDAAQTFIATVHDHLTNLQQAAQAQAAQTAADLAKQTEGDKIKQSGAEAQKAQADATVAAGTETEQVRDAQAVRQLHEAQAQKAIADAKQPAQAEDPSARINSAINMWKTGAVTLGAAFKQAGQPLPDGADPNEKFDPSSQGRSMAVFKAQAKSAAAQSLIAGSQVDDLLNRGVKISKFTPLKEGVPFGLGHGMVPENEQALLSAGGQYVSQFVLAVSGKAATDKEREFIMKQIIPMANDKPLVQKQKSLMREAFNQVAYDASQGANRPMSEIINDVIGAAKAKGAEPGMIKFLQSSQMKAMEMERARMKTTDSLSQPPLVADPTPSTPDSLNSFLQTYGR